MGLFSKKKKSVLNLIDFNVNDIDLSTFNFVGNETIILSILGIN